MHTVERDGIDNTPWGLVLLSDRPPTAEEIRRGLELEGMIDGTAL